MNFIHVSFTDKSKTAGQVIHTTSRLDFIHASNTSFTHEGKTAGQIIHAINHVIHGPGIHETHPPLRVGVSHASELITSERH